MASPSPAFEPAGATAGAVASESFSASTGVGFDSPELPATSGVTVSPSSASQACVVASRTSADVAGTAAIAVASAGVATKSASSGATVWGLIQSVASPTGLSSIVIGTTQVLVSCTG